MIVIRSDWFANLDIFIASLCYTCNCIVSLLSSQQQEQDPTNLYIANLPLTFKENDVEALLAQYGQVISTRILRDTSGQSKGVGFARFAWKNLRYADRVTLLLLISPESCVCFVCKIRLLSWEIKEISISHHCIISCHGTIWKCRYCNVM